MEVPAPLPPHSAIDVARCHTYYRHRGGVAEWGAGSRMRVETTDAASGAGRPIVERAAGPGARLPAVERSRARWLIGAVLGWALIYALLYLPAHGNGSDFQVFYAAATAQAHAGNPYSWPALWRVQQALYNGGIGHSTPFYFAPYGNPPPFALLVRPLIALPESAAYRLWALGVIVTTALGAYLGLARWPRTRRVPAAALVALSPAALLNVRLGQSSSLLLLGLGTAIWLLARGRPALAGAALSIGFVKPHLMGPVALILVLALPRQERRAAATGLIAALAGWAALACATGGIGVFGRWWSSVHNFYGSIRLQPDVASVAGIFYSSVPDTLVGPLNAACLSLAAAIGLGFLRRGWRGDRRARDRAFGGGLAAYCALSPYVHTGDQVLLALPILALIGPNRRGLREAAVLLAASAAILAPIVVFRDYHTSGINALPPLCLLLAYLLRAPAGAPLLTEAGTAQSRG